jgi:bifunctional non-homologous end joining protein LigD
MAFDFCIPTRGTAVPSTPDWLHEIKYDGYRLRVERDGDRVRLITRNGYDWNRQKQFIIDGEAVILGVDGVPDFNALHSRKHDEEVQLYAFDILTLDGEDLRPLPLSLRKTSLVRLLAQRTDGIFVAPFEQGEIGTDLFRACCNMGLEGLVSKRVDRRYRGGRSPDWVKVKNRKHILVAYRHGHSEGLGKGTTASVEPKSEHAQLDCGPDPTSPALRASSASFVKIFFPAMRPDSQAPVI